VISADNLYCYLILCGWLNMSAQFQRSWRHS